MNLVDKAWPTTQMVADRMGLTPRRVRQLIASRQLHAMLVGEKAVTYSFDSRFNKSNRLGPHPCRGSAYWAIDPVSVELLIEHRAEHDRWCAAHRADNDAKRKAFFEKMRNRLRDAKSRLYHRLV
jgi:hypothetical protein